MAKKYELTPEHRAQLEPWRDRWIANAMSTQAMTEVDRELCRDAVTKMYAAAKLPAPKHIVFVPSPFVLRFAGGFAAATWHKSKGNPATWSATRAATWSATRDATRAATWSATVDATRDATRGPTEAATWDATRGPTEAATRAATEAATRDATEAATVDATVDATRDATRGPTEAATEAATRAATWDDLSNWYVIGCDMRTLANQLGVGEFGLMCAVEAWRMWTGGNQYSGYDAYLSFFQDVASLKLPEYDAYASWRTLAEHSGPRITHPDFCMISDRPSALMVDDRNRPHNENGPFCEWRDGSRLYSIHGVRVSAAIVEHPEQITVTQIEAEQNAEVRRIMVDRYKNGSEVSGAAAYLIDSGAKVLDDDADHGTLFFRERADDTPLVMVRVTNNTVEPDGTIRQFFLRVHPELRPMMVGKKLGRPQKMTARNAVASTWGMRGDEFRPEART